MLVDLSALEFLDSTGLRLIVDLHQQCEAAERSFSVRLGHGAARRLFEVSGLRHTFSEAPEEDY
jgi:anti-anti-sigma factor